MARSTITVRNLDDDVKRRLRMRAAARGRSLEAEVRTILTEAAREKAVEPLDFAKAVAEIIDPVGGMVLDLPPRAALRDPPRFDDDSDGDDR